MNMKLVDEITARQLRQDIPEFSSGDTIKVYVRIIENKKERNQVFEGVVMQRRGSGGCAGVPEADAHRELVLLGCAGKRVLSDLY